MTFQIRPYEFDRDDEVISLLHKVFKPWQGGRDYFLWKYRMFNPADCGIPRGWIIEYDNQVVGFNGYLPRKVKVGNEVIWALQSFDTVIDLDFRGKRLFEQLQERVYEEVSKLGVEWVYGWTSEMGFRAFTRKAGWRVWGYQRYLMRILDSRGYLREKVKNPFVSWAGRVVINCISRSSKILWSGKVQSEPRFPGTIDVLCKQFESSLEMIAVRRADYLNWRLSNPLLKTVLLCAYEGQRLVAYLVIVQNDEDSSTEILDCVSSSDSALQALLHKAEVMGRKHGSKIILFRVNEGYPLAKLFRRAGYFWSRTKFPMLGRFIGKQVGLENFIFKSKKKLHWTIFDRNE